MAVSVILTVKCTEYTVQLQKDAFTSWS